MIDWIIAYLLVGNFSWLYQIYRNPEPEGVKSLLAGYIIFLIGWPYILNNAAAEFEKMMDNQPSGQPNPGELADELRENFDLDGGDQ